MLMTAVRRLNRFLYSHSMLTERMTSISRGELSWSCERLLRSWQREPSLRR